MKITIVIFIKRKEFGFMSNNIKCENDRTRVVHLELARPKMLDFLFELFIHIISIFMR